jgi:hypothetical protein
VIIKRQTSIEDTAVELSLPNYIAEFSAMSHNQRRFIIRWGIGMNLKKKEGIHQFSIDRSRCFKKNTVVQVVNMDGIVQGVFTFMIGDKIMNY